MWGEVQSMIEFNLKVIIARHEQDTGSFTALGEGTGLNKNTINSIAANKSRRDERFSWMRPKPVDLRRDKK